MECVLVNIEPRTSRINGGVYYRLTWVNLTDMTRWETDVQDTYKNWEKNGWARMVQLKQYGLYGNLNRQRTQTRTGVGVITADSYPELILSIPDQETAVEVVLQEQQRLTQVYSTTMFDQIFAPEN